jgi:hypothetical protein
LIGVAYEVTALQFLGSADSGLGMPSIAKWAEGKKARNRMAKVGNKIQWETMMAAVDGMKVQQEYQQKLSAAKTPEERAQLEHEMQVATTSIMLRIIWTMTSVDITSSIHEACQMVFFDQSVEKETRKLRAKAVKKLGEIFQSIPEPEFPDGEKKDAKYLFEEAAMAATLETIKQKDGAIRCWWIRSLLIKRMKFRFRFDLVGLAYSYTSNFEPTLNQSTRRSLF